MRIAWIVIGTIEQRTGGYLYDRLVVDRLRERGDDVRVISLPGSSRGRTRCALACVASRVRGADVVVGDELCFRTLASAWPLMALGLRRVVLVHHLSCWEPPPESPRARSLRAMEAAAVAGADACFATSAWTADRLRNEGFAREVAIAEPGADRLLRVPRRRAQDDGRVRLLFVGSLVARKRVDLVLTAMERTNDPRVELVIVGDPRRDPRSAHAWKHRVARTPALARAVSFSGLLEDDALAQAYADADALVLASSLEGYGMVATEALYAGLPVIGARAGALPHVLGNGAEATLFAPGDAGALATCIARFVDEIDLRRTMREAARARAAQLPRWDDTATTVRTLLTL